MKAVFVILLTVMQFCTAGHKYIRLLKAWVTFCFALCLFHTTGSNHTSNPNKESKDCSCVFYKSTLLIKIVTTNV